MGTDKQKLEEPRLIAIEGGDGSGKTSIRKLLFKELSELGRVPISISGSCWLDLDSTETITKAKYFKQAFSQSEIMNAYIMERLTQEEVLFTPNLKYRDVLTDRYVISDVVYNKLHFGIDYETSITAFKEKRFFEPDLIIFMDTPPEVAVQRLIDRGNTIHHWESLEKQKKVYEGYKSIIQENELGFRCPLHVVDNTRPLTEVEQEVLAITGLFQS